MPTSRGLAGVRPRFILDQPASVVLVPLMAKLSDCVCSAPDGTRTVRLECHTRGGSWRLTVFPGGFRGQTTSACDIEAVLLSGELTMAGSRFGAGDVLPAGPLEAIGTSTAGALVLSWSVQLADHSLSA